MDGRDEGEEEEERLRELHRRGCGGCRLDLEGVVAP